MIDLHKLRLIFPFALLLAYGIFHCGYFFMPDYSDHYRLFARMVFPLGLFTIVSCFRELRHSTLFWVVLTYMLYLLASSLWAPEPDWYRLGQKATICVYLITLIASTRYLIRWKSEYFNSMMFVFILVATAAAAFNIAHFYSENSFPNTRLVMYGSLTNQNEFSNIFGIFAILALAKFQQKRTIAVSLSAAAIAASSLLFIWLNQSRTAFVALMLSLLIMVFLSGNVRRGMRWMIGVLFAISIALVMIFPEVIEEAMVRGTSLRPQIWLEIWRHAVEAPILGHGLTTKVAVQFENIRLFETAHNAYLQVFWQGGLVGLGIFLLLLYVAARQAWVTGRRDGDMTIFCMLMFTMIVMLSGVDTLIERPRDQWILFWLPIALLLAGRQSGKPAGYTIAQRPASNAS